MKIAKDITTLIGKTPLVKINHLLPADCDSNVYAKLESFNPLGSIKDRIALAMIEDAEKKGLLDKDTVLIEPTSGNTGIGLAYIAAVKGYRLILTMPETMSIERRKLLKMLGAELILTPAESGMKGAIEKAYQLEKELPRTYVPQQFNNNSNPEIHSQTTAKEILEDTDGQLDIFVSAVGTGGTITGVGKVLKEHNAKIKVIAVEPFSSAVLSGEKPGSHKIQGIGAGFIPEVLDLSICDKVIKVKDEDAFVTTRALAKKEGILAGISSGAAMFAVLELLKSDENRNKDIVVIFPDTGERYLSNWQV